MKTLCSTFYRYCLTVQIKNNCFLLASILFFIASATTITQAQTISGTVFTDGNNNGVKDATDVGFPNATIKAYLVGSTVVSSTTAANDGTYTLTGLAAGIKYRIEFTPFLGFNDGAVGTSSASSIQFATAGATNINFGIFLPGKCGTDPDPRLIGSCGLFADPLNPPATPPSISVASWRYQTDFYPQTKWGAFNYSTVQPHQDDLLATEVGVPWAMARVPNTNYVLMVPISSPETGVFASGGASGTTAIYMVDYSGANAAYSTHKTLVQLSSVGFPLTAVNPIGAVQPRFGEYGLGGIAVSPDAKYVYVANLGKGNIMRIDISGVTYGSLPATAPTAGNITEINFPTSIAGFTSGTDGYFRATAMKRHGDDIYIAGTFDGSLRADNSAVRIVVFKLNVATNALTEVFSFNPIAFDAGNINTAPVPQKRWMAGPDNSDATIGGKETKYIQPVVSGFDFDNYGAITLGITNRGVYNLNTANEVGYVVSTWRNADGTYTLENAGARGPLTAANTSTTMHDVLGTGPGGNVFYDQSIGHPYLFSGGLLNITSKNVMAIGLTDPLMVQSFGVRYDQQNDGGIVGGIGLGGGKLFALVGVDAVCAIKDPIEVGNYIWKDSNDNGIMDGSELPLAGVTVELLNSGGTVIATATTDANGNYIFSSDPNRTSTTSHKYNLTQLTPQTNFTIRIPNASGGSIQAPLTGLYVTLLNQGTNDLVDSDGTLSGTSDTYSFTLGSEGQNNHSIDFGFGTTPSCVTPTATASATQPACTGTNSPNNGGITIAGFTTGQRYQYTSGVTFTGTATPATITAIPAGGVITSTLPNTSGSYTVRIYDATDNACFVDRVVTITAVTCCTPPSPTGTGATLCAGNTATLTVTGCDATYPAVWYSNATLTTQVGTGNSFTTPVLSTTTSYYVACVKDATCKSSGATVTATVTPLPVAGTPVVTQATCNAAGTAANNDASISITGITNATVYAYTTDGSTPAFAGATAVSGGAINLTGIANPAAAVTYKFRIFNGSATCYIDVTATLNPKTCTPTCVPPSPTGTGATLCAGNTATLTVTGCDATYPAVWYSNATLTTQVGTGNSFTTPVLSTTTSYYVACVKDATCKSSGATVTATVTPLPIAGSPVVTQATCNAAGTAANNDASIAISGITNATVYAYTTDGSTPAFAGATAMSGGAINLTGIANPAAAVTYKFRIFNGSATCYIDVTATLNPKTCSPTCVPPSPTGTGATLCAGNTATLTVTGCDATYPAVWYSNAALTTQVGTGNSFTTPVLSTTTSYYVACVKDATCKSSGATVTATVTPLPTAGTPVVTQATCNAAGTAANNDASIAISGITNATVYAYTTDGSTPAFAGATAVSGGAINLTNIANPAAAVTYKFRIFNGSATCFTDVTATLNPKTCTPTCVPPSPTGTGASVCSGNTATLTVTGCNATYSAVWYSNATLTTQVGTGNSFTTPVLSTTTSYYVACVKDATCKSSGATVTATVTPLPVAGTPVVTQATCNAAGTAANNDASIAISGITNATVYAYTTDGSTPAFAGATAVSGGAINLTALANPAAAVTYKFRIFNGSATCYIDVTATLNPKTCTVTCTPPSGKGYGEPATCINGASNNDSKITLYDVTGATKYGYSLGVTYTGANYAGATAISGSTATITGLANTGSNMTFTVRLYSGNDACYEDIQITVPYKDCFIGCDISGGADQLICSPTTTVDLPDAAATQEWIVGTYNAGAATINASTGVVSGLSTNGIYSFILREKASPTCQDEVYLFKGTMELPFVTSCESFYELPTVSGVTWSSVSGGASVTSGGLVTGMNTNGHYVFSASFGGCTATMTVEKITCPCTLPTNGTPTSTAGTCSGSSLNNDASITIGTIVGDKAAISTAGAASYDGSAYSSATAVSGGSITFSNLQNNKAYIIRIYNTLSTCYKDVTFTTATRTCCPSPNCGTVTVNKN